MYPVGIFFIIFPLNLINPHPVMNLEISIKHTITNQCRAGCWWLLAVCWCFVWLNCFICSGLAPPCPGTGELRRAPVQHPFLGNSVMVFWNVLVGLPFLVSQRVPSAGLVRCALLLLLCWAPGGLSVDGRTVWRIVHHQSSMVPGDGNGKTHTQQLRVSMMPSAGFSFFW